MEYTALALILAAVMFFLMEFGIRLEPSTEEMGDPARKFKLVFVIASFLMGIPLIGLGINIATESGASAAVLDTMNAAYWGYIAICIISTFALLIYFLYYVPKMFQAALEQRKREEDE